VAAAEFELGIGHRPAGGADAPQPMRARVDRSGSRRGSFEWSWVVAYVNFGHGETQPIFPLDGTQAVPDLDADDLLSAMSDDLLADGDLWNALRRLFQRGAQNPQGGRMPGSRISSALLMVVQQSSPGLDAGRHQKA